MITSKVIGAQVVVYKSQRGPLTTKAARTDQKTSKITQKLHSFALAGIPTAVALVINHSIFTKYHKQGGTFGLKRGFPDYKVASRPQKAAQLDQNTSKVVQKASHSSWMGDLSAVTSMHLKDGWESGGHFI